MIQRAHFDFGGRRWRLLVEEGHLSLREMTTAEPLAAAVGMWQEGKGLRLYGWLIPEPPGIERAVRTVLLTGRFEEIATHHPKLPTPCPLGLPVDLGRTYGELTPFARAPRPTGDNKRRRWWHCRCSCGAIVQRTSASLLRSDRTPRCQVNCAGADAGERESA